MDRNFLVQLTNSLYQLTLLFPKKEPLRYKMRELADDILANSLRITNKKAEDCPPRILEEMEVLDYFFEVAKVQNWVKSENILRLQKDYSKLKEELKTEVDLEKTVEIRLQQSQSNLERQEKILAILREKGRAQVWEIKEIFPQKSKRTLRRDFEFLLKQGLIERIGERNETFYRLL